MIDRLPAGYAEELEEAEAGLAAAGQILADREKRKTAPRPPQGQPVFGMTGRTFTPGGGIQ